MTPASIFLSYAREDAPSARRIAEALRASGHEVWFDENELRGGDAWDAKIRRQIRECTLFLPIISAQTQARPEGYFRREWKLAVERTHDMAAGIAFLVPIVIDDTVEGDALVPEEFLRVQWTRLPGALPSPAFLQQVGRLVAAPRGLVRATPGTSGGHARPAGPSPAVAPGQVPEATGSAPATKKPRRTPLILAGIGAAVATVFLVLRDRPTPAPHPVPATTAAPAAAAGAAAVPASGAPAPATATAELAKSIAVLPFANMSEDKENGFFTDGVHEDILTNLALIRDLKVISRTTVVRYRDSKKSMREIGDELGVAYVLEGSVRRVGSRVRVTGQLINTRTDEHVWAKSYDRDLTDIFAIQAALAQEIAGALAAAISPETRQQLARRPTENPAAYELYLRARDVRNRAPTSDRKALEDAETFLKAALDLDRKFAIAWGELAVVHSLRLFWEQDISPARRQQAEAAAAEARRLAPDAPEVIRSLGTYAYYAFRDYDQATAAFQRIIAQQPNDASGHASLALILRRQGRWNESIASQRRAVELDPANISYLRNQLSTYTHVRRWNEARAVQQLLIVLLPGDLYEQYQACELEYEATGDLTPIRSYLAKLTPEMRDGPAGRFIRKNLARELGDYAAFRAIHEVDPVIAGFEQREIAVWQAAVMHLLHGQPALARETAEGLLKELNERQSAGGPREMRAQQTRALALAVLGRTDEALNLLGELDAILPESRDALDSSFNAWARALVLALADRKEEAVEELRGLLAKPTRFGVHRIRASFVAHKLRGYAPFEALLADPKHHAPLY